MPRRHSSVGRASAWSHTMGQWQHNRSLLPLFWTPEIHLWCDSCWPLCSQAILFHIPASRHWWVLKLGPHKRTQFLQKKFFEYFKFQFNLINTFTEASFWFYVTDLLWFVGLNYDRDIQITVEYWTCCTGFEWNKPRCTYVHLKNLF